MGRRPLPPYYHIRSDLAANVRLPKMPVGFGVSHPAAWKSSKGNDIMLKELFNLTGKVALVTGGSKGLGKAMARGLAEAGADVVISSRHENELRPAPEEILRGTDRKGRFVVADMSKRDQVQALAKTALDQMGRVDVLINNAGTNKPQAIDAISDADWDNVMEINLSSIMVLSRALVPQMKERRWGRIIHISSVMGFLSKEKRNIYSATKTALIGLARSM